MDAAWKQVLDELRLPRTPRLHELGGSYTAWRAEVSADIKTVSQWSIYRG